MDKETYEFWTQYWAVFHAWMAATIAVPYAVMKQLEESSK